MNGLRPPSTAPAQPQFAVFRQPGFTEYRVENWRLARDGNGRVVMGVTGWKWYYALIPLVLAILWPRVHERPISLTVLALALAGLVYSKCTQVLWESVIVFPSFGIQLETHRGLPWFAPLRIDRRFIPLEALQDFIIHEGLQGWNVRYYLAAITSSTSGAVQVHVAFENLLPHFPVLLTVYRGLHRILNDGR
ncbi:hypothetical protein C8F01DRAFT_1131873 [Mycena amicta]|nr:hypothetical protein C8F01DRAFT_1131873 [Mycena amicta]